MKDLKLTLTGMQAAVLLQILLHYNVMWLQDKRIRLMAQAQMAKLIKRLQSIDISSTKQHSIKLSGAQAAAFEVCFEQAEATFTTDAQQAAQLYSQEVLRSVSAQIHQYLINV